MNTYNIKSLPLEDVIQDVANELNTGYYEKCSTFTVEIPEEYGSGYINGIDFLDGVGVIQYNCMFHEDTELVFNLSQVHPLKFLFCYQNKLTHKFSDDDELHLIDQHQNAIVASHRRNGHVLRFVGGSHTSVYSLEVIRSQFKSKMNCDIQDIDERTKSLFLDIEANDKFYYRGFYSLQIANLINKIRLHQDNNFLNKLYQEGMAYQFLTEQIVLFQRDNVIERKRVAIGDFGIQQIDAASKYIRTHLMDELSIEGLSNKFGLNKNKLQEGFKVLFGKTVNNYIQDQRLEVASVLLSESTLNIAQVAEKVGLKSLSYLSKVFKQKYNISPKEFQKKHRETVTKSGL